jgi:hypothetical protein
MHATVGVVMVPVYIDVTGVACVVARTSSNGTHPQHLTTRPGCKMTQVKLFPVVIASAETPGPTSKVRSALPISPGLSPMLLPEFVLRAPSWPKLLDLFITDQNEKSHARAIVGKRLAQINERNSIRRSRRRRVLLMTM